MLTSPDARWVLDVFEKAIRPADAASVTAWCALHLRLIGSARSEAFQAEITPWVIEPLNRANDGTRRVTFIKPIQSGGTTVGEGVLCHGLATFNGGDVAYYWPNQSAADERWAKHTEKRFRACPPLMERTSPDRFKFTKSQVIFQHCNFLQLGVNLDRSVASDSFRLVVCEELHIEQGGWEEGRLAQVEGRTTAHWNSVIYLISNAGRKGGQLHKAFLRGTRQHWEVKCPGCGQYHRMRTQWEDKEAHLGGLRYDADGCRLGNGEYDYQKLAPTIFFQLPCGHRIKDNVSERRALSLSGRYGAPDNPGALLTDRSYTLEAVAVDYIPWLTLIQQKHAALLSRARGDPKPWLDYLRERECRFVGEEETHIARVVELKERPKDRGGLPDKVVRYAALDRQKGHAAAGDLPHWWLFIQDWNARGDSLVVFEGRLIDDAEAVSTLRRFGLAPDIFDAAGQPTALCVVVDSGWDTDHVYAFCLRHGYCAIKVDGDVSGVPKLYAHEDGSQRIFSTPQMLYQVVGCQATCQASAWEPRFYHISKWGAFARLEHVRASREVRWEVPEGVSDDFKAHMQAWLLETRRQPGTNELKQTWRQVADRDDLYCGASYCVVSAEMDGLIGAGATATKETTTP